MARYLFVNQYYWPDFASTGQHLTDLCEHLAAEGHEVRVVCSRGRYLEGKGTAPRRETRNGVSVRRVAATSFGKRSFAGRLVDYLSFHLLANLCVLRWRWADVVVTLTTPPLIGLTGRLAKALHGTKHVNFVMDLHPEAEFESGMVGRRSLLGRALRLCSSVTLKGADMNVVLGRFQGARVRNWGVAESRIAEIPVWSDGREIYPVAHAENALRERMGWADRFVVMYSGNAGIVHVFDELLDAAEQLASTDPRVLFVFVGGGPRRAEVEAAVRERSLENLQFVDYFDRSELRFSLSAADVHFMSLRPEHVGVAVPGKLYGILAAGRPVLFVGAEQSDSAETIQLAQAGSCFGLREGRALAEEIRALEASPSRCRELGANGRRYFEEHHERAGCVAAWSELLATVVGGETRELVQVTEPRASLDTIPAALPARNRTTAPANERTRSR